MTLDFTNASSDWGIPTDYVKTAATYTNGTYTISFGASSKGHKALDPKGGVIMGQSGATLTLPAFSFDVEKIVVYGTSGASTAVRENIYVGSTAVSTAATNAQKNLTFNIKDAYQTKGNKYVLKVTNKNNTQFSKIEIYKKKSLKTETTTTFEKSEVNLIDGDENDFMGQTATVKAGDVVLDKASVKYSKTGDNIFEDSETFETDGILILKKGSYGKATIKAVYSGDDTYEGSETSYTVNYSAAKTPTLSFSTDNVTVKQGEEKSFAKPTITFTDERGDDVTESAELTYSVTPEGVVEIDKSNGDVTKWVAPGVATIKAHTDYGYDASYTLTYEKVKLATTLTLNAPSTKGNIGDVLSLPSYTLKAGDTELTDKNVTYKSGNETVAKFEDNALKLLAVGKATITVRFDGDEDYEASEASYDVSVVDPNVMDVTFDFSKPENYGYGVSSGSSHDGDLDNNGGLIESNKDNKVDGEPNVVLCFTKATGSTANRFWTASNKTVLRFYQGTTITIGAEGYKVTKVTYNITTGLSLKYADNGTAYIEYPDGNNKDLKTMTVTLSKLPELTLSDESDNAATISANAGKLVYAHLNTRTLKPSVWNTFCVPFDVTVKGSALEGAKVKQVKEVVDNGESVTFTFEDAATVEAGKAYLVMPTEAIVNPSFSGVTVKDVTPANCSGNETYKFVGVYSPREVSEAEFGTIYGVNNNNKLAKIQGNTSIRGMRAYFEIPAGAAAKLAFNDGEATAIDAVDAAAAQTAVRVYNLNGQYVGASLSALPRGVYVINGKKVMK